MPVQAASVAIWAMERGDKEFIARHRDRLMEFVNEHPSNFLQQIAVGTLTKISTDKEH